MAQTLLKTEVGVVSRLPPAGDVQPANSLSDRHDATVTEDARRDEGEGGAGVTRKARPKAAARSVEYKINNFHMRWPVLSAETSHHNIGRGSEAAEAVWRQRQVGDPVWR